MRLLRRKWRGAGWTGVIVYMRGPCPGGHCSSLSFSFIGKQIIRNVYFTRFGFFPASVVVVVIVVVVVVGDGLFQRLARFLV